MTIQQALDFFNYGIKEGIYDETILTGLSEEAIIEFAEKEEMRAQSIYENEKENESI